MPQIQRDEKSSSPKLAPRRLLHIEGNEDGTVGGSHRSLYELVRRVDRTRFEPVVLFYQSNPYVEALVDSGAEVFAWDAARRRERSGTTRIGKAWRAVEAIWRRVRFLSRQEIDLVHLNNKPSAYVWNWLPAARISGVPVVSHCRAIPRRPERAVKRRLLGRYNTIVANSDFVADELLRCGVPDSRVVRVYNGIAIEEFRNRVTRPGADVRNEFGIDPETVLLVMVGHLRSWKGQDRVLKALRRLPDHQRRTLALLLVGEATASEQGYADDLRALAGKPPLKGRIIFAGARNDVPSLMNAADIVVHASTEPEPFGLVILEGMACGKAVIASRLGGPAEIVSKGAGMLFDPQEDGSLATCLGKLIEQPELRRALGKRALVRVEDFDVRHTVRGMERVYDRVLAGRPVGTPDVER